MVTSAQNATTQTPEFTLTQFFCTLAFEKLNELLRLANLQHVDLDTKTDTVSFIYFDLREVGGPHGSYIPSLTRAIQKIFKRSMQKSTRKTDVALSFRGGEFLLMVKLPKTISEGERNDMIARIAKRVFSFWNLEVSANSTIRHLAGAKWQVCHIDPTSRLEIRV